MQRSSGFSCPTGGLTAPCDLLRPRRGGRRRLVVPGDDTVFELSLHPGDLDSGWVRSMSSVSGQQAA